MPEHPWGPRYIAWFCGAVYSSDQSGDRLSKARPARRHCQCCDNWRWASREVGVDVRKDPQIEADVEFIVDARNYIEDLLVDHDRLEAEVEVLKDALVEMHDDKTRATRALTAVAHEAMRLYEERNTLREATQRKGGHNERPTMPPPASPPKGQGGHQPRATGEPEGQHPTKSGSNVQPGGRGDAT